MIPVDPPEVNLGDKPDLLVQVATECREMLLASGFGKSGQTNTLWGMVRDACAALAASRAELAELANVAGKAIALRTVDFASGEQAVGLPRHALIDAMMDSISERDASRAEVGRLGKALREQSVELKAAVAAIDIAGPALEVLSAAGNARASAALLEMRVAVDAIKLSAQPAPLGNCACGKLATESWGGITMCAGCLALTREAVGATDKVVSDLLDKVTGKPAPEKPTEPCPSDCELEPRHCPMAVDCGTKGPACPKKPRLTPHGRVIHEKGTIDVSGFPYPPETLDNEPAKPAGGGK